MLVFIFVFIFSSLEQKVRVQLVVRLENNDTVMEDDQIWLSGALSLNEHNEYYFRAAFNATQDNLYSEVGRIK